MPSSDHYLFTAARFANCIEQKLLEKIAVNIGKGLGWKSIELDVCHKWWLTINKIVLIPNWHDSGVWRYTFVNFVNFVELNMNVINIYIWLGIDFMRTCCSLDLFKMRLPNFFLSWESFPHASHTLKIVNSGGEKCCNRQFLLWRVTSSDRCALHLV